MTFISVISLKQNSPTKSSSTKNTVLLSDCISIKQLYRIKNERKHAYIRITIPEKVLKKVGWRQGDVINFLKKENEETYVFEYITNPKLITDGLILRSYNKTGSLYTEYRLLDNDFFTIAPLENKSIVKYITFENLTIDNGKIIFSLKNRGIF